MTGLEGALCVGQGPLFESVDLADHHEAKAICGQCPAIAACGRMVRGMNHGAADGRPVGTWAGMLYGVPKIPRTPRAIEHGTSKGYYQHRNRKEDACAACLAAMRFDSWFQRKYGAKV